MVEMGSSGWCLVWGIPVFCQCHPLRMGLLKEPPLGLGSLMIIWHGRHPKKNGYILSLQERTGQERRMGKEERGKEDRGKEERGKEERGKEGRENRKMRHEVRAPEKSEEKQKKKSLKLERE